MPRNSSGTYSLYTPGNPVTPSTVITTTWANNTLSDLATALTDSLSRSGDGGMLAPLELAAGTVGAPGLSWTAEPTAGLYRASAGNFRYAIGGADVTTWTSTGFAVSGTLGVTGNTSITAGLLLGSATGGNQGAGTVNAVGVYDDGVLLTNQTGANPTASIGLSAVNGSAGTFMRSDAAPALSQAIAPTWTATHTFTPGSGRAITANGNANQYTVFVSGNSTSGQSFGLGLRAGTTVADVAIEVTNQAGTRNFLTILGNGVHTFGNTTDNPSFTFSGTGSVTSGGVHLNPAGSAAAPAYSFSGDTSSGMFLGASNVLSFAAAGSNRLNISSTSIRPFLPVLAIDGSAAAPPYTFDNDPDTGIYRSSANTIAFSAGGATPLLIDAAKINGITYWNTDGSGATPSFTFANDTDTGIYRVSSNSLGLSSGGTLRLQVQDQILFQDGSAASPTIAFQNDPDTGVYRIGANSLGLATGGSNRVTVGPGVQVGAPTGGDQGAGTINATAVYDDGLQIFPNIPRSTTTTTLAASDLGKCVAVTTNIAIPASVFSAGDSIMIYNDSAATVNITIAAGTLRLAGTTTTGTRTLAVRGLAQLWFNVGGGTPEVICSGNVT